MTLTLHLLWVNNRISFLHWYASIVLIAK